jgi:predicted permease
VRGWSGVRERLRALLRRRREEEALDEEMRFHLEMETGKLLRAGWDAGAARREAYRRFGGVDRMKERTREERGISTVETLASDVRFALRGFARTPGLTCTAIVALTLGVGATTAAYSVVDAVLLRPLPYAGAERMVQLWEQDARGGRFFPAYDNFVDWRERATTLERLAATMDPGPTTVLGDFEPVQVANLAITRGLFEGLGVAPVLGRLPTPSENAPGGPPLVLVSAGFWRDRLGSPASLEGVTVEFSGRVASVIGVLPAGLDLFGRHDVYWPLEQDPPRGRGTYALRAFGWLAPGVDVAAADAELDRIVADLKREHGDALNAESALARPLDDVLLGSHRGGLWLLLGASALVLLVGCLNVAGALLARGKARERELAVRLALGAGRHRVFRQLVTEAALLAATGGAAGALLAAVGVRLLTRAGSGVIPRLETVTVDPKVLGVALAASVGAALLAGVLPARGTLRGLSPTLRAGTSGTRSRERAWNGLIAAEAALTLALLMGATLLLRSLVSIVEADVGFEPEGVLTARIVVPEGSFDSDEERAAFYESVLARVSGTPGVEDAGLVNLLPLDAFNRSGGVRLADAEEWSGFAEWRPADAGYLAALGIDLLEGRLFEERPPEGVTPVVVSRPFAERLAPDGSALGLRLVASIDPRQEPLEIVGVVEEARLWRYGRGVQSTVYLPWRARPEATGSMTLALRATGDEEPIARVVRDAVRAGSPRVAVELDRLDRQVVATQLDRRFVIGVLVTFAFVALVLALVGVYGIVAYAVERRRRESGIRIALGATVGRVRRGMVTRVLGMVAAGSVAGLVLAALGAGLVDALLYEVGPRDPLSAALAVALLLLTAAAAAWIPAWRHGRIDPAGVLRSE